MGMRYGADSINFKQGPSPHCQVLLCADDTFLKGEIGPGFEVYVEFPLTASGKSLLIKVRML